MNSGVDDTAPPEPRRRTRYFDRAKHPHDWRWWVGLVGKTLIVLGMLMFGFVAYQLWGTGIQTARAQNRLEDQFQAALESTTTTTEAPSTTTSEPDPGDTLPTSTSSTVPVAPTTLPVAGGTGLGRIQIPRIGLDWMFVEGVGRDDLSQGPGHFRETPMPGQLGNAAIAGHRTTHGAPFLELDQVEAGDVIEIQTLAGAYEYVVVSTEVVNPGDYAAVIPTVDPSVATLTLATCHPAYTTKDRLIIHAVLVPENSSQVFAPPWTTTPANTSPDTTTSDAVTLPGEEIPGDSVETLPDTVTPDTVTPDTVPAVAFEVVDDTFGQGWFDDSAAIPHVLAWGLLLAGVAVGSYQLAKKCRRLWVAFLVGTVPFVVVLYFWYENINRLLPPGL